MNITDVRVRKITAEGKMKAIVSITIDDVFVVHDIKVIDGEKGLFIAMPSKKATDGEYREIAHTINSKTREDLQNLILSRYEQALLEPDTEEYVIFLIVRALSLADFLCKDAHAFAVEYCRENLFSMIRFLV